LIIKINKKVLEKLALTLYEPGLIIKNELLQLLQNLHTVKPDILAAILFYEFAKGPTWVAI
jgi:hypothetical protein